MEIALLRSNLSRSSSQSDECNSAMMHEGEKQELRLFQREYPQGSPRPLFIKIRKVAMSQTMATILLFARVVLFEHDKIRSIFAEKCQSCFMHCNNVFIFSVV